MNDAVEESTPGDLIAAARTLAAVGERRILGIAGAPGAGKSTLAEYLVASLGPEVAVLVPMDGFHLSNEVLRDLGRHGSKGAHDTFDDGGYARLLQTIRSQRPGDPVVYAPKFRRDIEESIGSAIPVRSTVPLVITEGNYLLLKSDVWSAARASVDEVWFLDLPAEERRIRLVRRHERYGKSSEEASFWAAGSDERNAEVVAATAGRADRVVRLGQD
ncbi:MAG: nucleoside/nucleotide kinase family protein [Rhodococcus sp. (in: high G+C Gram-positive bacteria)]